jgi:hypothetical protein
MKADLAALLHPFVLRGAHAARVTGEAAVEIALRPLPNDTGWGAVIAGEQVFGSGSQERLLRDLEWLIIAQAAARTRERVIWHAASLAWGNQAVILLADSGHGKSTLSVGLALRGWRPLADDLTLLDPTTRTLDPFRRCFHVSPPASIQAAEAGLLTWPAPALQDYARPKRWGAAHCAPAWLVVVRRDTTQPSHLAPISQAEAAGRLFAATLRTQAPVSSARLAAQVAGSALGCWRLINNDLNAALDALIATLTPVA